MNEFENTRKFWSEEIVRGNLLYPDVNVIRFVRRNFKPGSVILDYGCGAGRNTIALAKAGYECIAMDYTQEALEMVKSKILAEGVDAKLIKNSDFDVPLQEESVDAVVADGSLFYNKKKDIIVILSNLSKVLKTGGKIWADWRTKEDSLYQNGIDLGEGLFKLEGGTKREGASYFFCDEEDLVEMYEKAGLSIESIDYYGYTERNKEIQCSWYHVVAYR